MEWEGIPSTALVHEALAGSADAMKRFSKMPDYPYIKVLYPLSPTGPWTEEEIAGLVDILIPQIEQRLLDPGGNS